jgi:hypothetical protein
MNFETAFASGLVIGILANFPRACQPKRLRWRLYAENAVRDISRLRAWRYVFDNKYPTMSSYRSTNFGCGAYRSWPSGINQHCWRMDEMLPR